MTDDVAAIVTDVTASDIIEVHETVSIVEIVAAGTTTIQEFDLYDDIEIYDSVDINTVGGGTSVTVVDVVTREIVDVATCTGQDGADGIDAEDLEVKYATRKDMVPEYPTVNDTTIYKGFALPNTPDSSAAWLIQRKIITKVGPNEYDSATTFAGTGVYDQIWDNRAILPYL